jgi:predicted nucleic acid-binding Zn ribbon protein
VGEKKTDGNPENPHQNCEKASRTCVVCGQAILQVSGQATLYCSTACRAKAYRQRRSSADTPGRVDDDPDDDDFFSPTDALIAGEKKTEPNGRHSPGDSSQPTPVVRDDGHRPFTVHSLYSGVNSESEPNGRHSPGDSSQPPLVEPGPPDDVIAWGEQLLDELRAGRVQLPPVELKPGHAVLVPEQFLTSHLAEARLGIGAALENLRRYRRVLEAVSGLRRGKE